MTQPKDAWGNQAGEVIPLPRPDTPQLDTHANPRLVRLDVDHIFAPLPPVPWLIRALDMCPGAPTLVAGYGFSGKSVAMQSAAVSIAAGRKVWECFAARKGRVLWCDFEQGQRLTRARFQRLAASLMLSPDDVRGRLELVSMPGVYLDSPGAEDYWSRECEGVGVSFMAALHTVRVRRHISTRNGTRTAQALPHQGHFPSTPRAIRTPDLRLRRLRGRTPRSRIQRNLSQARRRRSAWNRMKRGVGRNSWPKLGCLRKTREAPTKGPKPQA
ncbi:MAG: AAA family ATPase [Polyangiaceae bacterium]|nr:AAA family ATPase [Polyangiaceae bacterium]